MARPNSIPIQQKPRDFKRVLAQTAMGKSVAGFFHFEAYADSEWGRKFVKLWSAHDEEWLQEFDLSRPDLDGIRFVFTKTKSAAIKMHQKQRQAGENVCTVVDMDHDARGKSLKEAGEGIASTFPACTLSTLQFIKKESNGLDRPHLSDVIQRILPTLVEVEEVIEPAIVGTQVLLESGNKYYNKHFERKRITEPLNDHELAKSLAIAGGQPRDEIDKTVQYDIEDKMRVHATADVNKRIRGLFGGLLRSLVSTENVN